MIHYKPVTKSHSLLDNEYHLHTNTLYTVHNHKLYKDGLPESTTKTTYFDLSKELTATGHKNILTINKTTKILDSEINFIKIICKNVLVSTKKFTYLYLKDVEVGRVSGATTCATRNGKGRIVVGMESGMVAELGKWKLLYQHSGAVVGVLWSNNRLISVTKNGTVFKNKNEVFEFKIDENEIVVGMDCFNEHVLILTDLRLIELLDSAHDTFLDLEKKTWNPACSKIDCCCEFKNTGEVEKKETQFFRFVKIVDGVIMTDEKELFILESRKLYILGNTEVTSVNAENRLTICSSNRMQIFGVESRIVAHHHTPIITQLVKNNSIVTCSQGAIATYNNYELSLLLNFSSTGICCYQKNFIIIAENGNLCTLNPENQKIEEKWVAHEKEITSLCANNDYLVTSSMDKTVKLWMGKTCIGTGKHKDRINCVYIDKYVYSLSTSLKTWSIPEMQCITTLDFENPCVSIKVYKNDVYVGDAEGIIKVIRKNKEIYTIKNHGDRVWGMWIGESDIQSFYESFRDAYILNQSCKIEGKSNILVSGDADGILSLNLENTKEYNEELKNVEMEKKEEEARIDIMINNNDLINLVNTLIIKNDKKTEFYFRKLFYENRFALKDVIKDETVVEPVLKRMMQKNKNTELVLNVVKDFGYKKCCDKQIEYLDDLFMEMCAVKKIFKNIISDEIDSIL